MLQQPTLQQLRELKLIGMAQGFEEQVQQPTMSSLSFEERIAFLVDREVSYRKNRRLERLLKTAKLRQKACIEDIDYQKPRGLDKAQVLSLTQGQWLQQKQNLIITGASGVGKSWLACAFGFQACRQGINVRHYRLSRLLESIRIAHADGSYPKLMKQLEKTELLLLDDFGIDILNRGQRNDLLEILEDRHQRASIIITSQLPIAEWHAFIGEAMIADAILDRVIHDSYQLNLKGDSMRKLRKKNEETADGKIDEKK